MENKPTYLIHSAKGSTWHKKYHQYIKKIGDKYFYSAEKYAEYAKTQAAKVGDKVKEVKETINYKPEKPEPVKVVVPGPKNNYGKRMTEQDARLKAEEKKSTTRSASTNGRETKVTDGGNGVEKRGDGTGQGKVGNGTYLSEKQKGPSETKKAQVEENYKKNQQKDKQEEEQKGNSEEKQQTQQSTDNKRKEEYSDTGSNKGGNGQTYQEVFEKEKAQFWEKQNAKKDEEEEEESSSKSSSKKKSGKSSKGSGSSSSSSVADIESKSAADMTDDELDRMALAVIRGTYGNGQARKDALGDNYEMIQQRVNDIMRGTRSSVASSGGSGSTNAQKANEYTDTGSNKGGSTRTNTNTNNRNNKQSSKHEELAKELAGLGIDINNMTDFQIEQIRKDLSKALKHSAIDCINRKRMYEPNAYCIQHSAIRPTKLYTIRR